MKKIILSIIIVNFFSFFAQSESKNVERIFFFRIIAFHKKYDLYCTVQPCGYYKYESKFLDGKVYFTYEGRDFYEKSLYDQNISYLTDLVPLTMWTNQKGEVFRLKKGYGPVIDRDKTGAGTEYGYARDN